MRVVFTLLIATLLAGCLTPKKADKQLAAVDKKFPEKMASYCTSHYPCKEGEIVIDTVYELRDSIIEIPCEMIDTIHNTIIDTVIRKVITIKKSIEYRDRVINKNLYILDSAKIQVLISEHNKYKAESEKALGKKNKLLNIISGVLLALLLIILLLILVLSKRR